MNVLDNCTYSDVLGHGIPIRLLGTIKFYSFELLTLVENEFDFFSDNELIIRTVNSKKKAVYFSNNMNGSLLMSEALFSLKAATVFEPLVFDIIFSYTKIQEADNFTTPSISFTPISVECNDFRKIFLDVDSVIFAEPELKLSELFSMIQTKLNDEIIRFSNAYKSFHHLMKAHSIRRLIQLHYLLNDCVLSIILPSDETKDEENWRGDISKEHNLENTIQRCQALFVPPETLNRMTNNGEKLINPHSSINTQLVESYLVKGRYTYYHYLQDGFDDKGWGCAYRSLQTIISWYVWQGWSQIGIPDHKGIQMILVKLGDKDLSFINSRSWIGSFEINLVLQNLLQVESRIIPINKNCEMVGLFDDFRSHFENFGAPIMIGGGVLAHTIIGIAKDASKKVRFLVLDPHYTGASNDLQTIISKSWCGWKDVSFWKDNTSYNLCFPSHPLKDK